MNFINDTPLRSIEKLKISNKSSFSQVSLVSIVKQKRTHSYEEIEPRASVFKKEQANKKPIMFETSQIENFRYKSQDDLSEYLNSRFPDLKVGTSNLMNNEKKTLEIEKEEDLSKKVENSRKSLKASKESSIRQIEIDRSPSHRQNTNLNFNEPRLTEEEIKKYVRKLYFIMNFKALQIFMIFIYISVIFLYDLPVISLVYVLMAAEVYSIFNELFKWRKEPHVYDMNNLSVL